HLCSAPGANLLSGPLRGLHNAVFRHVPHGGVRGVVRASVSGRTLSAHGGDEDATGHGKIRLTNCNIPRTSARHFVLLSSVVAVFGQQKAPRRTLNVYLVVPSRRRADAARTALECLRPTQLYLRSSDRSVADLT